MDRKPQQQTLSVRISESLREYLERSKDVLSATRGESVSLSDVAKTLLESAKDDRLDRRLEVAQLREKPTESLIAMRDKFRAGQPWTIAEWIFAAQYIQIACEQFDRIPLSPRAEPFLDLLQAFLVVRSLGQGASQRRDVYYLGNLSDKPYWNERWLDESVVPQVVEALIEEIRADGNGKKALGAGENFYLAIRDEAYPSMMALNEGLRPFLPTLFRWAVRGHWIRERRALWVTTDGALKSPPLPQVSHGDISISAHAAATNLILTVGVESRDASFRIASYPALLDFSSMMRAMKLDEIWNCESFHVASLSATEDTPAHYELSDRYLTMSIRFQEQQWEELKIAYTRMLSEPAVQAVCEQLSWMYGDF